MASTGVEQLPAIETVGLHKDFRLEGHTIPVLKGVDLCVASREWVALVGPSGSGKTTLLHLLGALDVPTGGRVAWFGDAYQGMSAGRRARLRRDTLGMVFQAYHLFPELNAFENVMLPGLHWGRDKAAVRATARRLLDEFGLGDRLRHRPRELSGGEQQRVALARALVNEPRILLADEPTGNLDADAGRVIIDIFSKLHQSGKTIVMVTHDRDLAREGNRVLRLHEGRLAATSDDR